MHCKSLTTLVIVLFLIISCLPVVISYNIPLNRIIYVDDDGGADFTRIQDAINASNDGDTVFVYSGTYYENILIFNKTINLYAEDKKTTIIKNIKQEHGTVLVIEESWCVNISGFTITNSSKDCNPGLNVLRSKRISLDNLDIIDNWYGGLIQHSNNITLSNLTVNNPSQGALGFNSVNDSKIINCHIFNNEAFAILIMDNTNNLTIENCYFFNNRISIFLDSECNNNRIKNCIFTNNEDNCISVLGANNTVIEQCQFLNNKDDGVFIYYSNNNKVINNTFLNNGIYILNSYNNTFSGNILNNKHVVYFEGESNINIEEAGQVILINCNNVIIRNQTLTNTAVGISLSNSNNCQIINNIISKNSHVGVIVYISNNITITYNNISFNTWGGIGIGSNSNDNIIKNNILRNNGYYSIDLWQSSQNNIEGNIIQNNMDDGIILSLSSNNIVTSNLIEGNIKGLTFFESNNNVIEKNNFIDNVHNTFFDFIPRYSMNQYRGNYWDDWIGIRFKLLRFLPYRIPSLFPNFDWRPAREPYDIPIPEVP